MNLKFKVLIKEKKRRMRKNPKEEHKMLNVNINN
jgi:hypothetical protein